MNPLSEHRRANDRAWYVVAFQWFFAFLVDSYHGLSLARILAIAFGATCCIVSIQTKHIAGGAVTIMIFCLATAFGKTVFQAALNRWTGTNATTENVTLTGDIAKIIDAVKSRRASTGGLYEPTHD